MRARNLPLLLLPLALALVGCRGFQLETPPDFVELEEPDWSDYALRATSARGVVLAVRVVDNDVHGSQTFWLEAIKERLRGERGYALLEESPLSAASGEEGRLLRCGRDQDGQAYLYWLGVWVTPGRIFLVEAGGKKAEVEPLTAALQSAFAGFRIGL